MDKGAEFIKAINRRYPLYREQQQTVVTFHAEPGDDFDPDIDRMADTPNYFRQYESINASSTQPKTIVFHAPAELFASKDMRYLFKQIIKYFLEANFTLYLWNNLQALKITSEKFVETYIDSIEFTNRQAILEKFASLRLSEQEVIIFDCIDVECLCNVAFSITNVRFIWGPILNGAYLNWLAKFGGSSYQPRLYQKKKDFLENDIYMNLARYATINKKEFKELVRNLSTERKLSLVLVTGGYNPVHLPILIAKFFEFDRLKVISQDPDDLLPGELTKTIASSQNPFRFRCRSFEIAIGRPKSGNCYPFKISDLDGLLYICTKNAVGLQELYLSYDLGGKGVEVINDFWLVKLAGLATIKKFTIRNWVASYLPVIRQCAQLESLTIECAGDLNLLIHDSNTLFLQSLKSLCLYTVTIDIKTLIELLNMTPNLKELKLKGLRNLEGYNDYITRENVVKLKALPRLEKVVIQGVDFDSAFYFEIFKNCQKTLKKLVFKYSSLPFFQKEQVDALCFQNLVSLHCTTKDNNAIGLLWQIINKSRYLEELVIRGSNVIVIDHESHDNHSIVQAIDSLVTQGPWDNLKSIEAIRLQKAHVPLLKVIGRSRNLERLNMSIEHASERFFDGYSALMNSYQWSYLQYLSISIGDSFRPKRYQKDFSFGSIIYQIIRGSRNIAFLRLHGVEFREDELIELNSSDFHGLKSLENTQTNWVPPRAIVQNDLSHKLVVIEDFIKQSSEKSAMDLSVVSVPSDVTELATLHPSKLSEDVSTYMEIQTSELFRLLNRFNSLEKLYLVYAKCKDDGIADEKSLYLPYLTILDASYSLISIELLAVLLKAAPNLKVLNLKWNFSIEQKEVMLLKLLQDLSLELINVSLCNFSQQFLEVLRKNHPGIIIIDHTKVDYYYLRWIRERNKAERPLEVTSTNLTVSGRNTIEIIPSFYDAHERLVRDRVKILGEYYTPNYKPMAPPELCVNLAAKYLQEKDTNKKLKFGVKRFNLLAGEFAVIPSKSTLDVLVGLTVSTDYQLFVETELRQYAITSTSKQFDVYYLIEASDFNNETAPWKSIKTEDFKWVGEIRLISIHSLEKNAASEKLKALPPLEQIAVIEKYFYEAKKQAMGTQPKNENDFQFYNAVIESHGGSCEDKGIAAGYILKALWHKCLYQGNKTHAYIAVRIDSDYWPIEVGGLPCDVKIIPLPPIESFIQSKPALEVKPKEIPPSRMLEQLRPMPPKELSTFEAYLQWLLQKTEHLPLTKRQIIISVEDQDDVNLFTNMAYALLRLEYTICTISDIAQLNYKASRLTGNGSISVDGEILQFLKSPSKKRLLFINMQNWSAKWNPLFEENRMLESHPLSDDILIIATQMPSQQLSVDLISRMGFATSFHLKHLLKNKADSCYLTEEESNKDASLVRVDLNESDNWRNKLVTDYDITEKGHFCMKPKDLIAATDKPARLLLVNPPTKNPSFTDFFEFVLSARCLFFNAETKKLPDETTLQWTTRKKSLMPYKDNVVLLSHETQHHWLYTLGADNFRQFFKRYVFSDQGGFVEIPGILKSYKRATLNILLTSELRHYQWVEIFEEAYNHHCHLRVIVPSIISIPNELMPTAAENVGNVEPTPLTAQNGVIITQSLLETADRISRELGNFELIFVSDAMSYSDLFVKIVKIDDRYHCDDSVACSGLQADKVVLLVGQLSQTVQMKIAGLFSENPHLILNHNIVLAKGRLLIITNQVSAFQFVLNRVVQNDLGLVQNTSARRDSQIKDKNNYFDELSAILGKSPYAIVMRNEDSDINHFICKTYPELIQKAHSRVITVHYGVKYFQNWLNAHEEGDHVLVISDSDQGATRKLFINLIQKKPRVLYQGKLVGITDRQKVVFTVTPKQQHHILKGLLGVLAENVLHYNFVSEIKLIKIEPTHYKPRLDVIYSKLKEQGFTVTPSRYKIIALLDAILLEREKQIKYPKSFTYTPLCPVLTGASGIGKTKLVISLLKILGYVDAASKEAAFVDSTKHYYNLNTQDISQYPEISRVPQHQQRMAIAVRACKMGSLLIGDELNVDPQLMEGLSILLNHYDSKIQSKAGFMFIATQNPLNYKNRHKIPHDLQPFIYPIDTPELNSNEIATILEGFGVTPYQARQLTKEFIRVGKELVSQGNTYALTVRDLFDYTKQQLSSGVIEYPSSPQVGLLSRFWAARDPEDELFNTTENDAYGLKH